MEGPSTTCKQFECRQVCLKTNSHDSSHNIRIESETKDKNEGPDSIAFGDSEANRGIISDDVISNPHGSVACIQCGLFYVAGNEPGQPSRTGTIYNTDEEGNKIGRKVFAKATIGEKLRIKRFLNHKRTAEKLGFSTPLELYRFCQVDVPYRKHEAHIRFGRFRRIC